MIVDKNQLSKVELKINTNGLYTICPRCNNSIAVSNCENFNKKINEHLENKLIYEKLDENDAVEIKYLFICPCCEGKKLLPIEFHLENEKTVLIFGAKIIKNELLEKSTHIFQKQLEHGGKK